MSSLKIQQEVEFSAPPERVWQYLIDPERVVTCLPGAAIDSWDGGTTCHGSIKLKVGPATMTYQGVADFLELDEARRRMRLEGKGREKAGGGQVTMVMVGTVEALDGGRSRVVVDVDLKLAGKIVRFGRGMIGVVSERIFQDFAACLAERLAVVERNGASPAASGPTDGPEALSPLRLLLRAILLRVRRLWRGD